MAMSDPKSSKPPDYAIGYRRPPRHTRFQPGRSGNPKGRPKGTKNFSTFFSEELAQPVTLTENGRRRRMPKRQALAKQVINKALSNDPKAAALVLEQIRRTEGSTESPVALDVKRTENKLVIESIIRRIRMNEHAPPEAASADVCENSR